MIASFLFVFAVVLFATVFNLMFFGWITSRFLAEREAKIAVFAFLLGGVILGGQIFGAKLEWPIGTDEIASLLGCVVGIAFVWIQFFRKDRVHG